jgi:hypothetical protein
MDRHHVSLQACVLVLLAGLGAVPAMAGESRSEKADDAFGHDRAAHAAADPPSLPIQPSSGKAGVDRFSVRNENIRESVRADGTVIVELNGEGMERMELDEGSTTPRAVCTSAIERTVVKKTDVVPDDFRGTSHLQGTAREYR